MLGILHLEFANDAVVEDTNQRCQHEGLRESQRLATTVAGQIALSLASLRLRETFVISPFAIH